MPLPTLLQAQEYAASPSPTALLLERFGCTEHPDGHGWLLCPDGVKRHAVFRSGDGTDSAEDRYLKWTIRENRLTSTMAIEAPHEVLDIRHEVTSSRVGAQGLVALHGAPRSHVESHQRFTFNGAPARRITTRGRLLRDVRTAHRRAVREVLADSAQLAQWRYAFESVPAPSATPYNPPAMPAPGEKWKGPGPARYEPTGFAPGTWFSWSDQAQGTVYVCQIQSLAPRGHVWIAGHDDGDEVPLLWKGRLTHRSGHKGPWDGRAATSLTVLATNGDGEDEGTLAVIYATAQQALAS
ncbi:hypothetical protein [Streptomyces sp. MT206]|uniref:hypothetical protein n=1 Tax=Streptomyces sp. MT206 TaxID=3031407 RepID=UPI002FC6BD2C